MPLPSGADFRSELESLRSETPPGFAVGYSGDWGAADALLAGADAWYSVVAGLLPAEALALTRAAQSRDVEKVRTINTAFEPLWSLFKEFGSFRVMFAIAETLDLGRFEPPRPVLGLQERARQRVKEALNALGSVSSL